MTTETGTARYIYVKDEQARHQFTEKARSYFQPRQCAPSATAAFKKIIRQIQRDGKGKPADEPPFVYLGGKSRRWVRLGEELAEEGALEDLHALLTDYIAFIRVNPTLHAAAVSGMAQLDACWSEIHAWKRCERSFLQGQSSLSRNLIDKTSPEPTEGWDI